MAVQHPHLASPREPTGRSDRSGDASGAHPPVRAARGARGRHGGGYAEYVALPAEWVARAPSTGDLVAAASLPLAGLTAWQAFERGGPTDGDAGAALADGGRLVPQVSTVLPLAEAARAHELSATGHTRGKIELALKS